jgi:aryl-alcohol dehydrogenase-like predicted oxidoreductase
MGLNAGFGANLSYDEAEPVLLKAIALGCTFWDTAVRRNRATVFTRFQATYAQKVVYGAGVNEKILGDFIRKHNVRDKVFSGWRCFVLLPERKHMVLKANRAAVASKCGIDVLDADHRVTNSSSHIKEYIEGTIERLGFSPDLYYLHRIDPSAFGPGTRRQSSGYKCCS